MSDCVKIQILEVDHIPNHLKIDGQVFLDLPGNFSLRLSKKLSQLNEIGKITIDGALGFDAPMTPLNDMILGYNLNPNVIDNDFDAISCIVWIGSHTAPQTKLFVKKGENSQKNYDLELQAEDHWIVGIKNCYLIDIDFGEFELLRNDVMAKIDNPKYEDADDIGVTFPLVNYGSLIDPQGQSPGPTSTLLYPVILMGDLRPWFHSLFILRKIYNHFNWNVECPLLETDLGRRIICYLLSADFSETNQDQLELRRFRSRLSSNFDVLLNTGDGFPTPNNYTICIFDQELIDNDNNYDPITGQFMGYSICDFFVDFTLCVTFDQDFLEFDYDEVRIEIVLLTNSGVELVQAADVWRGANFSSNPLLQIKIKAEDVAVLPGNKVYVRCSYYGDRGDIVEFKIGEGSLFYNEPKKIFLQDGDNMIINTTLNPKYKCLDFIKGLVHLFNFKIYTDFFNRTVYFYTPYEIEFYDETIEGFFTGNIIDINDLLECDKEVTEIPKNQSQDRFLSLQFKNAQDARIQDLDFPEDSPIFSKLIDFGSNLKQDTKTSRNPFFEPTINEGTNGLDILGSSVDTAQLLDNIDGKLSFNLGPRICIVKNVHQINEDLDSGSWDRQLFVYFELSPGAPQRNTICYAYQFPNATIEGPGGSSDPILLEEYLIFGDHEKDLYNLVYKQWLDNTVNNLKLSILVQMNQLHFFTWDERDYYSFEYFGRQVIGFYNAIKDFETCKSISTPMEIIPERAVSIFTGDDLTSGDDCDNSPQLIIDFNDPCYDFSLGGESNSGITSITYEWKYADETSWTTASQVCSPDRAFDARVTVVYDDDCPTAVDRKYVDPCGNSPEFEYEFDYVNDCLIVTIGGLNTSTVDGATIIEYSDDDGLNWNTYVGCLGILDQEILFRSTVQYIDSCADIDIEGSYDTPPNIPNCSAIDASLECVDAGNGNIVFNKIGETVGDVLFDLIKWRRQGDTEEDWTHWSDQMTPVVPMFPIESQRILIFNNDECPPYKGPIVQCNAPV